MRQGMNIWVHKMYFMSFVEMLFKNSKFAFKILHDLLLYAPLCNSLFACVSPISLLHTVVSWLLFQSNVAHGGWHYELFCLQSHCFCGSNSADYYLNNICFCQYRWLPTCNCSRPFSEAIGSTGRWNLAVLLLTLT